MTEYEDPETRAAFDALRHAVEPSVDVESARAELRGRKVPRSSRARRVGLAVIGAAAVVAGVAAVTALWTSNGSSQVVAAGSGPATTAPQSSGEDQAPCSDPLIIYMAPDSTAADIEGVRVALDATQGVEDVVFMDQEMVYQEFKENFAEDPDLVDSINPADLPVSFRANIRVRWSATELDIIEALPGVATAEIGVESSIGHGCISPELDKRITEEMHRCEKPDGLSVFMTPGSTEAEVEGVRAALAATDGVEDVVFVDKEMAYQEFRRLFAESPDFVDSIKPEDLPESFKVSTVVPWPKAELDEIKALPGVRSVEDGTREFNDLCGTSSTGGGGTSNPGSRATTTSGVPNSDGF